MTEEQKIKAIEKAAEEYRAQMARLKKDFNAKVKEILELARERKIGETRHKIKTHGKTRRR